MNKAHTPSIHRARCALTLSALLSSVFVAACGGDSGTAETAAPPPVANAPAPTQSPAPTVTPSASPTPMASPAPTLTPNPTPTVTPSASPTPTASPTATPTPAPTSTPSAGLPAEKTCNQTDFQAQILAAVNAARSSGYACASGNKPSTAALTWNDKLFEAAAAHSQDMATQIKDLSHTGSDGSNVGQRVTRVGYTWSRVGENIAVNQADANAVVQSWLQSSSGHCDNIMDTRLTQFAVACVNGTWGRYSDAPYYTMVLTAPR